MYIKKQPNVVYSLNHYIMVMSHDITFTRQSPRIAKNLTSPWRCNGVRVHSYARGHHEKVP